MKDSGQQGIESLKTDSAFVPMPRARTNLPNAHPEGFAEPRFINEIAKAGFFEEMSSQYGK